MAEFIVTLKTGQVWRCERIDMRYAELPSRKSWVWMFEVKNGEHRFIASIPADQIATIVINQKGY